MKIKNPKWIKNRNGKYFVQIFSKKYKKSFTVGTYDNLKEALFNRDKYISDNYNDITSGLLPRGISTKRNKYVAFLNVEKHQINLGYFNTLKDAVEYRYNYIYGLF